MTSLPPIYTAENCNVAFQLDWSLTLFWNAPPDTDDWLPALQAALHSFYMATFGEYDLGAVQGAAGEIRARNGRGQPLDRAE